jgi:hypothetical protein
MLLNALASTYQKMLLKAKNYAMTSILLKAKDSAVENAAEISRVSCAFHLT